jgi:L-ascorbate metabolism protein UlaG (beta-lactamase superfamily)
MSAEKIEEDLKMLRNFRSVGLLSLILGGLLGCSEPIARYERFFLTQKRSAPYQSSLTITWFGAAAILIDDGSTAILIDPFVSRKENSVLDIVLGRDAIVAEKLISRRVTRPPYRRVSAILVSHSHYDHVIDVSEFSEKLEVPVFGSRSTQKIVDGNGYGNFKMIENGQILKPTDIGAGFEITVLEGKHGSPPFLIDPLDEVVANDFEVPEPVSRYGMGEIHSFLIKHRQGTILYLGSAGVVLESLDEFVGQVDVVLLPLVGRPSTKMYLADVVGKLKPKSVIPIHFDNLFQAIAEPPKVVNQADLGGFFSEMQMVYPSVNTGLLRFDVPWSLDWIN